MARPRLIARFDDPGCFTLGEAVEALGLEKSAVKKEIEYLRGKGYVESVRRGLYALVPGTSGTAGADRYVLASKVTDPYVLSYHTTLELHGTAESALFNTLYIGGPSYFEPFTYEGITYRSVTLDPDLMELEGAVEETKRRGEPLHMAGRELALVQCADRPKYAGGLEEVVTSVGGFPYLRWGILQDILEGYDKTVLYRKVGFLLTLHQDRWQPPEQFLDTLRSRLGSGSTYFGVKPNQGGTHVPEWQVIVPDHVREESPLA